MPICVAKERASSGVILPSVVTSKNQSIVIGILSNPCILDKVVHKTNWRKGGVDNDFIDNFVGHLMSFRWNIPAPKANLQVECV